MAYDIEKFFHVSLDLLCIAGTDGYLKRVNPAFERTLGWRTEQLLSRPFIDFVHPDDVERTVREVEQLAAGIATLSFENRFRCSDGRYRQLRWTSYPEPETGLLYAVARDITERHRDAERFRLALESSPTAMLMVDEKGSIVLVNGATERLFGYGRDELIGSPVELLVPPRMGANHPSYRAEFMANPEARPMGGARDLTARRNGGLEFPVEIGLNPIETEEGTFVLGAIVDLTARKEAEREIVNLARELEAANRQLADMAATDALTGLKNRRAFFEELDRYVRLARRRGTSMSLLLADVDRFKDYNDQFGHPAGDEVLKAVARLLLETARRSDFVGRYGGEEFAVALPDTNVQGATALGERFRRAIEEYPWPDREVTASFGVSTVGLGPSKGRDDTGVGAMLIIEADRALYESKRSGRNRVTHASDLAEV